MNYIDKISYETAATEDIPIIFALAKDLIERYEDIDAIPYEGVLRWMRSKITENIANYQCILVDGVKVGYFHLDHGELESELDDLYIFPEYRGKGIGTAVIHNCVTLSQNPIFLYVFCKNAGAIRLYEKMGFVVTETVGNTRMIMRREG